MDAARRDASQYADGLGRVDTHLLMTSPGYTLSAAQTPPAELSLVITSTLVKPSRKRVWAVMRPAAPEPMTQMVLFSSGWKVVAIAPEEAEACNGALARPDAFYASRRFAGQGYTHVT